MGRLLPSALSRSRVPLLCASITCLVVLALAPGRALAQPSDPDDVEVVQTSHDLSQRLLHLPDVQFEASTARSHHLISVNPTVRYQTVGGFGAAMTDTSAWLIERETSAASRQALMGELFGPSGIHLSFVRVPIGASDFTRNGQPYTYDDMPAGQSDLSLTHFSIAHDHAYILPALLQARALNPQTEFLASPWTPPAWMKTNDSLGNSNDLGMLRTVANGAWARYFVKFLQAYARAGVPIRAITVQNESGTPTRYPGMNFPAVAQAAWTQRYLKPALARANLSPKLYAGDLGWGPDSNPAVTTAIFGATIHSVTGISWHCYYGTPGVMNEFRQAAPRLDEIVDECSPGGITPTPTPEIAISSMRDWASTVALWNLALDPKGGPVQAPNQGCPGCVGLATIDERSGGVWLTRSYYQLGQVSAFVSPGAQRIASNHFVSYVYPHRGLNVVSTGLDDVAFRNPDGSLVLVAYNNARKPIPFAVSWRHKTFNYDLPAEGTVTFVWRRSSLTKA